MIPFSVLDLSPIPQGSTAGDAFRNTLSLARLAEGLGFRRYWLAEHHNMPGVASAATAVVLAHVGAGTRTIRIGSGGVMLPNHAPLVIAEQFGTLEALYPGRVDLGLGRAPGTDGLTARALRRDLQAGAEQFPQDLLELQTYFEPPEAGQRIRAVPGTGLRVPIWLLGSSLFSAQLAAVLGLPFAFASHFAPDAMGQALAIYRERFQPSRQLDRPHAMVCVNVFAADTDAQARCLFTSLQQQFLNLRRGTPGEVPPPRDDMDAFWTPLERAAVEHSLACSFVGAADTVEHGLAAFIERVRPDELMIAGQIFDHDARLHSFEIVSDVRDRLALHGHAPTQQAAAFS